jgi:hypothetical protein
MHIKLGGLALAGALALAMSAHAEQALQKIAPDDYGVSVSAGVDYSSGKYGQPTRTDITVVPLNISVKKDFLRLSASIPYLRINGSGVVVGPDGAPLPGVPGATGNRAGFGDVSLGATASLPSDPLGGFEVDLSGRVKLPTSDESKHLGTGKTDFSVSADVSYPIGAWAPFVTLGYRFPGSPAGVELHDAFTSSVGTSFSMGRTVAIVSYDYAQASSPLAKDSHELFGGLNAPLTNRVNWTLYSTAGLSDGAPDYGVGLMLTAKLR